MRKDQAQQIAGMDLNTVLGGDDTPDSLKAYLCVFCTELQEAWQALSAQHTSVKYNIISKDCSTYINILRRTYDRQYRKAA